MSTKGIGRRGQVVRAGGRSRWRLLAFAVVAVTGLLVMRTAFAVHLINGIELEGNAVTEGALSHDWDEVYDDVQNSTNFSGTTARSFASDGSTNATIFTGGGSKDPIDLNQWAWKDGAGGLPDKDNLTNSFAARYSFAPSTACPSGGAPTCEVLYFGSDRFDNSGDAHQAFWFFQNPVSTTYDPNGDGVPDPCPQKIGGGTGFCDPRTGAPASHREGDLLVISNFSNGGTVSTIVIYRWNPAINGNLELLQTVENASCLAADPNDAFCGIVNLTNGTQTGGWSFTDKSGNSTYLQGEFFEAGVNLSTLGVGDECFASVLAESRSSTSTTATLKDFVLGQFANCTATITTVPSVGAGTIVPPGTSVTDSATISGGGVGNPPTPTGDVTFYICGPIATGVCTTGGTLVGTGTLSGANGTATATSPAVVKTVPGRYCFRAEWPGDDNYGPLTHTGSNDDECFRVQDTTSATSAQSWLPNDSATITAANGTALNGTLTFQLYTGDNCGVTSGSAVSGQNYSFPLSNAASPVTRNTTNSSYFVTATGASAHSWRVTFVSTDTNVVGSTHCEKTTMVITN